MAEHTERGGQNAPFLGPVNAVLSPPKQSPRSCDSFTHFSFASSWALCKFLQGAEIFTLKICQELDKVVVGVEKGWVKGENHPENNLI